MENEEEKWGEKEKKVDRAYVDLIDAAVHFPLANERKEKFNWPSVSRWIDFYSQ